jgi:hypothetical protein
MLQSCEIIATVQARRPAKPLGAIGGGWVVLGVGARVKGLVA